MIDWLRRDPAIGRSRRAHEPATIEVAGRELPIAITRHRTARRLTLRLAADGQAVRITLPHWCSAAEAVAFARARRGWLEQQLAKVPQARDPVAERELSWRGTRLAIDWRPGAPRRPLVDGTALVVGGAETGLHRRLQRWLEDEALRLFAADAADYCHRAGLPPAEVRLTRAKRRWGSCSSERVLRLNWRLVQAPDAVRRSVVAHEVAHLVHFDHSPAFHDLLDRLFEGEIAEANAWLSRHGRELYAAFG